ncbi:MAG: DegT/DnrJ/EryC1/StrS family aminotransferase [Elusimicrobia bacterium]|nr:DegT/DnrJ/EryC1/StrS family aminotransferase [Elusimicrobiota bacterium]MDE2237384.1 DegT/DnrJ/EryC1/StrS family aminotransferase [Elusimicrobiota bacterium]MDE2426935.1 DegT/DnrJ/EryC1/StrS family aminotransferase [Elusimicrobiota bacterium]
MRYNIFSGTNCGSECLEAVRSLSGSGPLLDGPDIAAYEAAFAQAAGTRYAFSLASGRMALYRLLEALDIGPGDEVILPAYTCVVVPNAILYRGAVPIYADIEPNGFNIDPAQAERRLTPRTKAIIAQHTYGRICDVDALNLLAGRRGIAVLEDCAHSLGACHNGKPSGSLSLAAYFSTDHSKVISTSTGGMITTSDEGLARRLRALQGETPFLKASRARAILATFVLEYVLMDPRLYRAGRLAHRLGGMLGLWAYFADELSLTRPTAYPYPARLSCAQARLGLSQLRRLEDNLAWRRRSAALYHRALTGSALADDPGHAWLRYTWLVEDREAWVRLLRPLLDMGIWFTSVAEGRSRDLREIGYEPGSCPVAERAASHCVNLPTHPRVLRPELLAERLAWAAAEGSGRYRLLATQLPTTGGSR